MTIHRTTPVVAAILGGLLAAAGCTASQHQSTATATATRTGPAASSSTATLSTVESLAVPVALQPIPPARQAISGPIAVARAWAAAANSTSYRDRRPGAWTARAAPFVAGIGATKERTAADGGGGQLWQHIHDDRCAVTVAGLAATVPSDAPHMAASRVVYLAGTTVVTCADHTVQRSAFTAELVVERASSSWHVVQVEY